MSFNIEQKPIFTVTVKVSPPGGEPQDFQATFLALDDEALEAFDLATTAGSVNFLEAVVQSVDDVVDNDGVVVASSPNLVTRLIGMSWVRTGLARAYFTGLTQAIEGN